MAKNADMRLHWGLTVEWAVCFNHASLCANASTLGLQILNTTVCVLCGVVPFSDSRRGFQPLLENQTIITSGCVNSYCQTFCCGNVLPFSEMFIFRCLRRFLLLGRFCVSVMMSKADSYESSVSFLWVEQDNSSPLSLVKNPVHIILLLSLFSYSSPFPLLSQMHPSGALPLTLQFVTSV